MRLPKAILTLLLLSFLLSPALPAERADLPTVDQLLARMDASVAKLTSFQADQRITHPSSDASTQVMHVVFEISVKEGKTLERFSGAAKSTGKDSDGNEVTYQGKAVCDGTFFWEEDRSSKSPEITVKKSEAHQSPKLKGLMTKGLEDDPGSYTVKLVGEDSIDGRKMFVLVRTLNPDKLLQRLVLKEDTTKLWVGQDDLIPYRSVRTFWRAHWEQASVTMVELFNVKLNEKIDPALFIYTPPAGAVVTDKTQPQP